MEICDEALMEKEICMGEFPSCDIDPMKVRLRISLNWDACKSTQRILFRAFSIDQRFFVLSCCAFVSLAAQAKMFYSMRLTVVMHPEYKIKLYLW